MHILLWNYCISVRLYRGKVHRKSAAYDSPFIVNEDGTLTLKDVVGSKRRKIKCRATTTATATTEAPTPTQGA